MKTTKPENFRTWLKALRSGKFKQTNGALHRTKHDVLPVGYCCLGVACEISHLGKWYRRVHTVRDGEETYVVDGYNHPGYLTRPIMEWLGLDPDEEDGGGYRIYLAEDGESYTLPVHTDEYRTKPVSELNDEGCDFATIADLLEKEYL